VAKPCTQSFGTSLFCCKPFGVGISFLGRATRGAGALEWGKNALLKPVAKAGEGLLDPVDPTQI
jgi:hypothetical protein